MPIISVSSGFADSPPQRLIRLGIRKSSVWSAYQRPAANRYLLGAGGYRTLPSKETNMERVDSGVYRDGH